MAGFLRLVHSLTHSHITPPPASASSTHTQHTFPTTCSTHLALARRPGPCANRCDYASCACGLWTQHSLSPSTLLWLTLRWRWQSRSGLFYWEWEEVTGAGGWDLGWEIGKRGILIPKQDNLVLPIWCHGRFGAGRFGAIFFILTKKNFKQNFFNHINKLYFFCKKI